MSLLTPDETKCLERAIGMFSHWNYADFCVVNDYAFKLLDYAFDGYETKKRLDILVDRNTLPWGAQPDAIRMVLPKGEYIEDYDRIFEYMSYFGITLKFVPVDSEVLKNISIDYDLNEKNIRVGIPSKTVEEFQKEIEREGYDCKKLDKTNIDRWKAKIGSYKEAGERKSDEELVEACEKCENLLNSLQQY